MANKRHLDILNQGVTAWNRWKYENSPSPQIKISNARLCGRKLTRKDVLWGNLSGSDLHSADLSGADLSLTNLRGVDLHDAILIRTNFSGADLSEANLRGAYLLDACLSGTDLCGADLSNADLSLADLTHSILKRAMLVGTNLESTNLIEADLSEAMLIDCRVYGISAWRIGLSDIKEQSNLRITPDDEPAITVDNLEVAQFIYLLLHNEKIRSLIDTIGKKGVLILGRFTEERKAVLDAIRIKLRELGFVPMMFDFERPTQRDFTETIKTLAGMSRFIIADITNPKSCPLELQATIPDYKIPFVPIIRENEAPFSMFQDLKNKFDWVLDILEYDSVDNLIEVMESAVVRPALEKAEQLVLMKARSISKRHVKAYKNSAPFSNQSIQPTRSTRG